MSGGHDVWGADFGQVGWHQPEPPESMQEPREAPAADVPARVSTGPLGQPQEHPGPDSGEPDPREPLGRVFHEQGRLTVNAEREKPFFVEPWELRTAKQREIDMRGASAVAAEAGRRYEAERTELTLARMSRSVRLAQVAAYMRDAARRDPGLEEVRAHILAIIGSEEEHDA